MNVLVVGATGSIGRLVVRMARKKGYRPTALVRDTTKLHLLPENIPFVQGDVSVPETLKNIDKNIDAIIFTLGADSQGRIGARAVNYCGVRNILNIYKNKPVKIVLMTAVGVTGRDGEYNRKTEAHDWKRRAERLVRLSGHPYTIVRPGWFDMNAPDQHKLVMSQGDRKHSGTPNDGVISREQIAEVLVAALANEAADNKTLELSAEKGEAQLDLTALFTRLLPDKKNEADGILDINNMPSELEPACVLKDREAIRNLLPA